jgi:Fur family peroxide stress response transcriptional regulator
VTECPPERVSTRRHRSRQRERILSWLRATDSHPTASQIHRALLPEMPELSLGTIYRNLEVLVAEGVVDEVASTGAATRYDGNVEPHHHFDCERCGRIFDVDLPVPRGLVKRLAEEVGLRASRVRISFVGACSDCDEEKKRRARRESGRS